MDVDLKGLVILADDERVADRIKILAQRLNGFAEHLADNEDRVEGEGDVLKRQRAEIRLVLCTFRGKLGHFLAAQRGEHAAQNHQKALAAGIDNAGFLQHGIHVDRFFERGFTLSDGLLQNVLDAVVFLACFHRAVGGKAGDGQDRALRGLHDRVVGGRDALLHGGGKSAAVSGFEPLGDAAEKEREDDPGVAARTAQQGACGHGRDLIDAYRVDLFELLRCGLYGETHVRARVAVRNGENIEVVDDLLCLRDRSCAEEQHLLEQSTGDGIVHRKVSF